MTTTTVTPATVAELARAASDARTLSETLAAQYGAEYRAGMWDTNRELAARCETAYSAAWSASEALRTAQLAAFTGRGSLVTCDVCGARFGLVDCPCDLWHACQYGPCEPECRDGAE
jgi:hypothetical protein